MNLFISWVFVCLYVSLSLISPFSLLLFISSLLFLFYILCPFPSLFFPSLTSLPSYPFSLSIHSPPSSLPLLSSTFSFLPSLTFFSLLSPPHSFLSFQLSLSPILSVLSHLSLLYIFLLSTPLPSLLHSLPLSPSLLSSLHSFFRYPLPSVYLIFIFSPFFCPFSPFSLFSLLSPHPFSSPFPLISILYPLSLSLSTPFCVSSSFSFLSLCPLSNFSPFLSYHPLSLLSFVFLLSILYPLLSLFSPFSLLPPFSLSSFLVSLLPSVLSLLSVFCSLLPISLLPSLSLLSLLSPIPYLSSPFLPSLLSPIHYLSYILSQFSLFSCFISAPISVSLFYSSPLHYPLSSHPFSRYSHVCLPSPFSLLSHLPSFPSPISPPFSIFPLHLLHSLLFLLSPSTLLHSLSPPCSFSSQVGWRVSWEGGEWEGK